MTRCPDRGQATVAEGPNPPGRDFVNALIRSQGARQETATASRVPAGSLFRPGRVPQVGPLPENLRILLPLRITDIPFVG